MAVELLPEAQILPWRGRGNVIAAAGVALLGFAGIRRYRDLLSVESGW